MPLNKQKGNMYGFVTHTWNTVKGKCPHDCSYCYMKRFPQGELHFDEKELKTDLGSGNTIFVGSSCDMWADDVPLDWQADTLKVCNIYDGNKYLFQTKNPDEFFQFLCDPGFPPFPKNSIFCVTLETNRFYVDYMGKTPNPYDRASVMYPHTFSIMTYLPRMITIEPIMDFDMTEFVLMLRKIEPLQVNIGADSGRNNLPEPPKEKILDLISALSEFATVYQKDNLRRLLK